MSEVHITKNNCCASAEKKSSRLDKIKNMSKNSKYISILREIFIGLAGAHAVYIFINFVFGNYPGGLLSILLVVTALYTHFDRRVATYTLNVAIELLLGATICVSRFELYYYEAVLKVRIYSFENNLNN
ncbi:uncharacterized protein CMU_030940 [Cryptosporidium muris RN66]|uniref:Uncharacterized protein n=1 Tax=Cryptosporidium muris (strain RN66) TaxID=441375 RepID=B6AIB2_CRYMR|nr:uncharacterized protein CMU_030940 [Cryptosporidium muris RN66]EEA07953.1 hypothetical protein CMU_030940 [Cryptosporidium muris RN66]|eukprot:XP_002142302.1 hypothetical protein [Cryptosporidium muris RN66]